MMPPPISTAAPELEAALAQLLRLVPADRVFLHEGCLYIVVATSAARGLQQYKAILESAGWNAAGLPWVVYALEDVCQGLDSGNMFFAVTFRAEQSVYDSGQSVLPLPLPERVARIARDSREAFAHGHARARAFLRAGCRCLEETPEVAAFLLHQAAEQMLRAFLLALTGRELKTHALAELLNRCRHYIPALRLFPPEQKDLLEQLDKAYVCARYAPQFRLDADTARQLCAPLQGLQRRLCGAFEAALARYAGAAIQEAAVSPPGH